MQGHSLFLWFFFPVFSPLARTLFAVAVAVVVAVAAAADADADADVKIHCANVSSVLCQL